MHRFRAARSIHLVIAFLLFGACAPPAAPPFDPAAESAKLLQRDAEWADAALAGKDVDKIPRQPLLLRDNGAVGGVRAAPLSRAPWGWN